MAKDPIYPFRQKTLPVASAKNFVALTLTLPVALVLWKKADSSARAIAPDRLRIDFKPTGDVDLWPSRDVRDDFLQIESTDEAVRFFSRYGTLNGGQAELKMAEVTDLQRRIRKERELTHQEFFASGKDLEAFFDRFPPNCMLLPGRAPFLQVETFDVRSALLAANYIDQIARIRASTCPQCGKQFQLPPKKEKKYCTNECQRKAGKLRWKEQQEVADAKAGK